MEGSENGTLNHEERPALAAATGFAVGPPMIGTLNHGMLRERRYAALFNLEELRRWNQIVITDDEDGTREGVRALRPRILEEETERPALAGAGNGITDDPIVITDDEDEISEDELIEMMLEYMCDRVEIDEVTHEEEAEKPTCAICIEGLHFVEEDGDGNRTLHRLPCSHVFHSDCISKWFRTSFTCPLCRRELPPP